MDIINVITTYNGHNLTERKSWQYEGPKFTFLEIAQKAFDSLNEK